MEKGSHSTPPTTTTATAVTATTGDSPSPFMTAPAASSTSSTNTSGSTASSGMQNPLRMLNKASHKISKPAARPHQLPRCQSSLSATSQDAAEPQQATQPVPQPPPPPPQQQPQPPPNNLAPPQPPVYNINKNDFRDVVQKLTGSTTHLNPRPPSAPAPPVKPATAPVMPPASATSSRLQRIRPPPLAQLGPRPPPLVHHPIPGPGVPPGPSALGGGGICGGPETGGGYAWARPWMSTPLSPLPPLPSVSAAAESPISAYMRRLQGGSGAAPNALLPLSPGPMGAPIFPLPSSPLGMGCLPSPRSAFQTTLPQSPRVPLPNPKMKDH